MISAPTRLAGHPCRSGAGQPPSFLWLTLLWVFSAGLGRVEVGGGVKERPAGRPRQRPQVLDAVADRRTLFGAEKQGGGRLLLVRIVGSGAAPGPGSRLVDRPEWGLSVIPSPRAAAWCAATGSRWAGSIRGGDHADPAQPGAGGHDQHDPHSPRGPGRSRRPGGRGGGQAAQVVIPQPVEHQRDQLSGGGTTPMLRPRRSPIRSRVCPRRVWPGTRCTASTAAQRTSREPCFVIRPRCTVVSDSWCFGVNPAHEASCSDRAKRPMSPISATNTAPSSGPTPGICWIAW